MAKKKHLHLEDDEAWLMTYADMITLLLCFFLIMISTMEPKAAKMEEVKKGMMSEFSQEEVATPFNSILNGFESIIESKNLHREVAVEETERGVMIEVDSQSLFESGSATLKAEGVDLLKEVAQQVLSLAMDVGEEGYIVEIEGHTDDVPINTPQFPSNWELSAARGITVLKLFMGEEIPPEHLKAAGYADTRPKVPNTDELGNPLPENRALNRRVVIRVEREG